MPTDIGAYEARGAKPGAVQHCYLWCRGRALVDTVADAHYGDKTASAMAFAALLNDEASG
jgi:hypothetical protein